MYGLGRRLPWVQWAFPTAPGGKGWFDCDFPVFEAGTEYGRIDEAVRAVHAMLGQIEDSGINASRILVGGFGPGAALALLAGRTYGKELAGMAMLCGWYMRPRVRSTEAGSRTPVLLCHGEEDDDVLFELFSEARARLSQSSVELNCHSYPGLRHAECAKAQTVLAAPKNFITFRLPTLTPAPPVPRSRAAGENENNEVEVPRCKLDDKVPACAAALDREDEQLLKGLAEQMVGELGPEEAAARVAGLMGGLGDIGVNEEGGLTIEDDGTSTSTALAAQLVDAAEAAQREATKCSVTSLEERGGALEVVLSLEGVSSLAEADLAVGTSQVELQLPGARKPFVVRLPKPVVADGEQKARFSKKSGLLKLTLMLVN